MSFMTTVFAQNVGPSRRHGKFFSQKPDINWDVAINFSHSTREAFKRSSRRSGLVWGTFLDIFFFSFRYLEEDSARHFQGIALQKCDIDE